MTGIFSKFCIATVIAGTGGVAIGTFPSFPNQSNSSNVTILKSTQHNPKETQPNSLTTEPSDSVLSQPRRGNVTDSQGPSLPKGANEDLPQEQALRTEITSDETAGQSEITPLTVESKGNCIIIDSLKNILEAKEQKEEDYYSLSCEDTHEDETGNIPKKWEGVFPKSIFKSTNWDKTQKLEIKVKEEGDDMFSDYDSGDEELKFGATFSSKQFTDSVSQLNVRWDYLDDYETEDNKTAVVVRFTQPASNKDIYLLWEIQ